MYEKILVYFFPLLLTIRERHGFVRFIGGVYLLLLPSSGSIYVYCESVCMWCWEMLREPIVGRHPFFTAAEFH